MNVPVPEPARKNADRGAVSDYHAKSRIVEPGYTRVQLCVDCVAVCTFLSLSLSLSPLSGSLDADRLLEPWSLDELLLEWCLPS